MGKRRKPASKQAAEGQLIFSGGEDSDEGYDSFAKMGFVCFEEIEGEEAEALLKSLSEQKKKKILLKDGTIKEEGDEGADGEDKKKKKKQKTKKEPKKEAVLAEDVAEIFLSPEDLPEWRKYNLDDTILLGLKKLGFLIPTKVQQETLESFYSGGPGGRDVVGSAPTGSGKTLAFGLPILNHILAHPEGLKALIIAPTRELALQIQQHLLQIHPKVRLALLIGGMSSEKQERLLSRDPQIVIGTPGRLADCIEGDVEGLAGKISQVPFLVIDEADRLVEAGHFKELDAVLAAVYKATPQDRRTFLFSATLSSTKDRDDGKRQQKGQPKRQLSSMDQLQAKIRFNGSPAIVNLATAHRIAEGISLSKIYCLPEEKDLFLVQHLLSQKEARKILVFVNSIEILKRVTPVLEVFGMETSSLHAQMQQRQRLQHLDKFKGAKGRIVLVTSDVSARGLDIPSVDLVIHYHLPTQSDTFVHRSGRTGRACQSGQSLALIAPQEVELEYKICRALRLSIPESPIASGLEGVERIKPLVDLARRIETLQGKIGQEAKDASWEARVSEDLGFDLDDCFGKGKKKRRCDGDDGDGKAAAIKKSKTELAALRSQFAHLRKALRL